MMENDSHYQPHDPTRRQDEILHGSNLDKIFGMPPVMPDEQIDEVVEQATQSVVESESATKLTTLSEMIKFHGEASKEAPSEIARDQALLAKIDSDMVYRLYELCNTSTPWTAERLAEAKSVYLDLKADATASGLKWGHIQWLLTHTFGVPKMLLDMEAK